MQEDWCFAEPHGECDQSEPNRGAGRGFRRSPDEDGESNRHERELVEPGDPVSGRGIGSSANPIAAVTAAVPAMLPNTIGAGRRRRARLGSESSALPARNRSRNVNHGQSAGRPNRQVSPRMSVRRPSRMTGILHLTWLAPGGMACTRWSCQTTELPVGLDSPRGADAGCGPSVLAQTRAGGGR
jgi:hypothetical protein